MANRTATVPDTPAAQERRMNADTVGRRLQARREQLGLKQAEVATQMGLSRTAYCQYESGTSSMTTQKVERAARVLKTRPEWLAFGTREPNGIEVVGWTGEDFERTAMWSLDEDWLQRKFNVPSWQVKVFYVEQPLPDYHAGDAVVIHQGAQPTTAPADFLFAIGKDVAIASMTRLAKGDTYRIFGPNKTHEDVKADFVKVYGRVLTTV